MNREELLAHLKENTKVLQRPELEEAFRAIDRADFVPEDYQAEAYEDYPLPIGYEQTISQPTTIAFMLELLEPKKGEKILDIGSGSGWSTALLARIVGEDGKVLGLELVQELAAFGKENLEKYNFAQARIEKAGEVLGRPEEAPFDRILVSAGAEELPDELIEQLTVGGMLVIPIGDSICKIEKKEDGLMQRSSPGFVFVPLITKE